MYTLGDFSVPNYSNNPAVTLSHTSYSMAVWMSKIMGYG